VAQSRHNASPVAWETVEREALSDHGIFTLYRVRRRHPLRGQLGDFVVLEAPPWVNIVPLTEEGHVIFIEQYRHGIDSITLEIPGGMVSPGEDPRLAAERECREETGYASEEPAQLLRINYPNPAFLTNVCYSYLWLNCRRVTEPRWDHHEEIAVRLVPLDEVPHLLRTGVIRHSLVLVALFSVLCRDITSDMKGLQGNPWGR